MSCPLPPDDLTDRLRSLVAGMLSELETMRRLLGELKDLRLIDGYPAKTGADQSPSGGAVHEPILPFQVAEFLGNTSGGFPLPDGVSVNNADAQEFRSVRAQEPPTC